jgi:MATE family multidrug resistance protein
MVSIGLATGTSVLTAEAVGRAEPGAPARASFVGLAINAVLMLVLGLTLIVFRVPISRAYTADVALAGTCAALFPILAAIVLPDGAQVVAAAGLRAQGDNWFPTASHLLAYALVMPVLAFVWAELAGQGVAGLLWASLAASVLSAGVLVARLYVLARRAERAPGLAGDVRISAQ